VSIFLKADAISKSPSVSSHIHCSLSLVSYSLNKLIDIAYFHGFGLLIFRKAMPDVKQQFEEMMQQLIQQMMQQMTQQMNSTTSDLN